jgi:hypothetical protein
MVCNSKTHIVSDDDIPEITSADFAGAKSLKTAMPDVVEA